MDKIEKVTDVLVDEEKIDLFTRRLSSVINELDTLNAKKQVVNVDSRHLEKVIPRQHLLRHIIPARSTV